MRFSFPNLLTFLITSALVISGYFGYQYLNKPQTQTSSPAPTALPSPTPKPTADWTTYTNSRYGYQLQYPPSLSVTEEDGPTNSQLVPNQKIQQVTLSDKSYTLTIYYEGDFNHGFEPWELDKREDFTLGDKPATKTILTSLESDNLWIIYTIENFHSFRIEASTNKSNVEVIDQILSTFKFTN